MGLIDWYRMRREIGLFFLTLKEGWSIEALQLGHIERIETALVLYMIVAWRINHVTRMGRIRPQMQANVLFEDDEWRAACILDKKKPPQSAQH